MGKEEDSCLNCRYFGKVEKKRDRVNGDEKYV